MSYLLGMLRNRLLPGVPLRATVFLLMAGSLSPAQVTYTDSFNTAVNYLTNGVAGRIWDGVYFGAGEFNNTGVGGGGPGSTIQRDDGSLSLV